MTTLAILTLRVSVILLAALAACVACRRHSAALRHTVLAAGVVAALLVSPLTAVMPSWDLLPSPETAWRIPASDGAPVAAERLTVAVRAGVAGVTVPKDSVHAGPVVRVLTIDRALVGLWLLGALIGAGILLTGLIRLARFSSGAVPLGDERWLSASARVARQLGLSRPVRMLTTPDAAICTWGVRRPSIVVPAHAVEWPDERIATVLGHELAHVSRGDWALQLAAAVLRVVFWFNPLIWLVHRRLRDEAERACDDTVLCLGTAQTTYAEHLLEIARSTRIRTVAFTAAACGAAALGLSAQNSLLSLHGSVYDSTGAVLPAVEMALTNDRGVKWTTPTDGQGKFEFDPVGPGEYELEATMAGFTSYKKKMTLEAPKDWNRIITLQVGTLEETITTVAKRPQKLAAAPASATGARVRVGGNIKQPAKTYDVRPTYPESMRAAGLEGTVPLEVVIGKDGKVIFARVVTAQVHPEFAKAATEAVERWEFTPTLLNGVPVEVTMTASVSFRLVD